MTLHYIQKYHVKFEDGTDDGPPMIYIDEDDIDGIEKIMI